MKIRPVAAHARDQRSAAARAARRVEQNRIEAAALAIALRSGAIGTKSIRRDVAEIGMAHQRSPCGKINRRMVRVGREASAFWHGL